jgi:3',5'-cyclic AMP phosphodiesterase CpdA
MSDSIKGSFLVLSDLHFGSDLSLEAEIPPLQIPLWMKIFAPRVRTYMESRCKSHDIAIVMHLPRYLKKVLREMQREGYERSDFDFCLLLGDLSTYANGGSYNFLSEYLTQTKYKEKTGSEIPGLGISRERLVLIPGNHDKLLRKNLDLFNTTFVKSLRIDHSLQPVSTLFLKRDLGDTEILFVLVEASIYALHDEELDRSAFSHLAAGEIPPKLRSEVTSKLERLRRGEPVDEIRLKDYRSTLKIMLVHYAVDDRAVLGPLPHGNEFVLSHRCTGLDQLVFDCKEEIDLVLHGHLHCPRIYNHFGTRVVSATTTTQKEGLNGFFVLKLFASGDLVVDHHIWNENAFMRDTNHNLNVRIALPPRSSDTNGRTISKASGSS